MRLALALLAGIMIAAAWPHASAAEIVRGNARVVDGDPMVADGRRIHILDIGAPEDAQLRFRKPQAVAHSARRCGLQAAHVLSDWIGGQTVNAARWAEARAKRG